uniref:PDZ domain-containing protein n=1 Tax=Glossina austeni TaxID=7395 RepID=A0A1A9V261_GLOAU
MPEPTYNALYSYGLEPPKRPPIIKLSCGIGDTDGFPAFDVDSDAYTIKDDSKWGFLITGGAEFHMPLTVFQVTTGGLADQGGIRLGDIILEINEEDATQLSLAQAHEKIDAAGKKIHFLVKTMEEDQEYGCEQGEEKSIVLRVPKPLPPPKDFSPTPLLGSRCWHPIMWIPPPEPPKPKKKKTKIEIDSEGNEVVIELSEDESSDEEEEELPHHRIMRNIKRFFTEVKEGEVRSRIIEDMLLALPSASKSAKD